MVGDPDYALLHLTSLAAGLGAAEPVDLALAAKEVFSAIHVNEASIRDVVEWMRAEITEEQTPR